MALTSYPIVFDTTTLLRPTKWQESSTVVENIIQTEAGTDCIEVIRYDKLNISAAFGVTDGWASTFKQFSKQNTIQVKIYDIETKAYKTRTMRMRSFKAKLKKDSELLQAVNGVWEITFELREI